MPKGRFICVIPSFYAIDGSHGANKNLPGSKGSNQSNTDLPIESEGLNSGFNTSSQYAKAFFDVLNFDAITVAPYMGEDSIRPFLEYESKFVIVLGLTSNKGAKDFELQKMGEDFLYEKVILPVA